jgi:hypothetical protein
MASVNRTTLPRVSGSHYYQRETIGTIVRGGIGLFYDKIPLNIGAFEQFQSFRVTTFNVNGINIADGPRLYANTTASGALDNPYSVAWNLQVDHEFTSRFLLRGGYEERRTRNDFIIEPIKQGTNAGLLLLDNTGRSVYREFQVVARGRLQEKRNVLRSVREIGSAWRLERLQFVFWKSPRSDYSHE